MTDPRLWAARTFGEEVDAGLRKLRQQAETAAQLRADTRRNRVHLAPETTPVRGAAPRLQVR